MKPGLAFILIGCIIVLLLVSVSQPANYDSSCIRAGEPPQPLACANEPAMISPRSFVRYLGIGNGISLALDRATHLWLQSKALPDLLR